MGSQWVISADFDCACQIVGHHSDQHPRSTWPAQESMFDKNDARVEQERAEAEEKRQRPGSDWCQHSDASYH